jgi:hypothetical protein
MAIIRDKFGNIVTETTKKTLLQIAQDAAGIPIAEQVGTDKVNCIKKKLEDLAAKAATVSLDTQQSYGDSIDG